MQRLILLAFTFIPFYLLLTLLLGPDILAKIQTNSSLPLSTQVTATVPVYWWLELTGWTSPGARVELTMRPTITRVAIADQEGKFTIKAALPRNLAPFCLIATDIDEVSSHPLCLKPPPQRSDILIKEVVMPPTLTLAKGKMLSGETVAAQGRTTPNSEVTPYLFEERPIFSFLNTKYKILDTFAPKVFAAEVPKPLVKSDQKGSYQLNLPTSITGTKRIFIGSTFLGNPSPKSNTLVFNVFSWWQMILQQIWMAITGLFGLLLRLILTPWGIIGVEIGIIGLVGYKLKSSRTVHSPAA